MIDTHSEAPERLSFGKYSSDSENRQVSVNYRGNAFHNACTMTMAGYGS